MDGIGPAIAKIKNAAMFEKSSNYGSHTNVFRQSLYTGAQSAYPANDEIDLYTCLRSGVERLDNLRLKKCVHLGDYASRFSRTGMLNLIIDGPQHLAVKTERRLPQIFELPRLSQAGKLCKHLVHVRAKLFIGSEQAKISIKAGRAGVIIPCPHMHVSPQFPFLAPYDHGHLGVGFMRSEEHTS